LLALFPTRNRQRVPSVPLRLKVEGLLVFGVWILVFLWSLDVGSWCFSIASSVFHPWLRKENPLIAAKT
jgi:hypothetical protein